MVDHDKAMAESMMTVSLLSRVLRLSAVEDEQPKGPIAVQRNNGTILSNTINGCCWVAIRYNNFQGMTLKVDGEIVAEATGIPGYVMSHWPKSYKQAKACIDRYAR